MVLDVIAGTVGAELVAGAIRGGAAKPHDLNELVTVTVRVPRSGVSAIEEHAEEMRVATGYKPSILDRVVKAFTRKPTRA
ncbi:hypothetical protein FHW79_006313 [Azospirillum sp. OGB3]|uniref:hypothetical protein n=1 Tax=Azospirillum sp. OGB3 TaxID=2587012 RepID=UPI00160633B3|nr:hypothetical protein [Azospirillum sp. OGB3]MBB3268638.1 hypothetical protein [Azospirillum sp. OGB3]